MLDFILQFLFLCAYVHVVKEVTNSMNGIFTEVFCISLLNMSQKSNFVLEELLTLPFCSSLLNRSQKCYLVLDEAESLPKKLCRSFDYVFKLNVEKPQMS
jgi:hypothetical protein